jgi:hypothetical protein
MRWRRIRLVVALALAVGSASPVPSAAAFGTIDSGGQHREHERITRASLACAGDAGSDDYCFEPASVDFLAGHDRDFGGVGAPDSDEISDPAAHCDGADFLEGSYPQTRGQATAALLNCVDHLRVRLGEAVDRAGDLLDGDGQVVGALEGLVGRADLLLGGKALLVSHGRTTVIEGSPALSRRGRGPRRGVALHPR